VSILKVSDEELQFMTGTEDFDRAVKALPMKVGLGLCHTRQVRFLRLQGWKQTRGSSRIPGEGGRDDWVRR